MPSPFVLKKIAIPGGGATAIAIDNDVAYIAYGGAAGTVAMLDLTTDVVRRTISVGASPVAVAVDPTSHTVYVVNAGDASLSVINGVSSRVVATIRVGHHPVAIALDPVRHVAYVANSADNTVSILDERTNAVRSTVAVGQGPTSIAVDSATGKAFVGSTNQGQGSISKIDAVTHVVTPTDVLGLQPNALGIDAVGKNLLVAGYSSALDGTTNLSGGLLTVMEEETLFTPAKTKITDTPATPIAAVVDASEQEMYVLAAPNVTGVPGRLLPLPIPDNFLGEPAFVPVGPAPIALALDPATHRIYVVNGDNTITVVQGVHAQ